jgi:hypothetical protein
MPSTKKGTKKPSTSSRTSSRNTTSSRTKAIKVATSVPHPAAAKKTASRAKTGSIIMVIHTPFKTGERRATVAGILDTKTKHIVFGISVCNPKDNFCRLEGRKLAISRAKEKPYFESSLPVEQQNTPGKAFISIARLVAGNKLNEIAVREAKRLASKGK